MPEIRPVRSSDRVQWDGLWRGHLRFYRQHVSAEVTDGTFARLVDERVQPHGLVAERDGRLVGFVHCVRVVRHSGSPYILHPLPAVRQGLGQRMPADDLIQTDTRRGCIGGRLPTLAAPE